MHLILASPACIARTIRYFVNCKELGIIGRSLQLEMSQFWSSAILSYSVSDLYRLRILFGIRLHSRCRLRRQNPCSRMEIQIVTTEMYRKVHNLQSKSTESHGSKEGKKFCRDMFPRFNEIPEPFALRAREFLRNSSHVFFVLRSSSSRRPSSLRKYSLKCRTNNYSSKSP